MKKQDKPVFYLNGKKLNVKRKSELATDKEWDEETDKNYSSATFTATVEGDLSPEFKEMMEQQDRVQNYANNILKPILDYAKVDENTIDPRLILQGLAGIVGHVIKHALDDPKNYKDAVDTFMHNVKVQMQTEIEFDK